MRLLRKILFYLFLILYLIICPLIILYSLGIIFKPQTQSLEETGLIHISTLPTGASVYVNKHRFLEKTPTMIQHLEPGEYRIKVILNGYLPWEKILSVEKNKATVVENILLVPKKWTGRSLTLNSFDGLLPLPPFAFLLYLQDQSLHNTYFIREDQTFHTQRLPEEAFIPLMNPNVLSNNIHIKKFYSCKDSPLLILKTDSEEKKFLSIHLNHNSPIPENITHILPKNPDTLSWEANDERTIFVQEKDTLHRLDLDTHTVFPDILKNVQSYCIFKGKLYVLTKDYIVKRFNKDGGEEEILLEDSQPAENLFGRHKDMRMTVLDDDILIFLSQNGALLSNRLPYLLVKEGVKDFLFDKRKKCLLLWSQNDLGILDFKKNTEDQIFEQGPLLTWLNIKAKNIKEAYWVKEGGGILYQDQNTLYLTETESFGQPVIYKITDIKPNSSIYYSDRRGMVFYLAPQTGHLSLLTLKSE